MKITNVYYGTVPFGVHAGLFGVQAHLSSGSAQTDERERLLKALQTFAHKKINVLYITLDPLNPPAESEMGVFLDEYRKTYPTIFFIVKGRFSKVPAWFPLIHHLIQHINLKDWKGIPCNELHAILTEPMDDPVVHLGSTSLYLIQDERINSQLMFDFVARSTNPWKFGMKPAQPVTVRVS